MRARRIPETTAFGAFAGSVFCGDELIFRETKNRRNIVESDVTGDP